MASKVATMKSIPYLASFFFTFAVAELLFDAPVLHTMMCEAPEIRNALSYGTIQHHYSILSVNM